MVSLAQDFYIQVHQTSHTYHEILKIHNQFGKNLPRGRHTRWSNRWTVL